MKFIKELFYKIFYKIDEINLVDGFIKEEESDKDHQFGATNYGTAVVNPTAQWLDYLPMYEAQKGKLVDTMACVSYSLLNILEILAIYKYEENRNKSDRFTSKVTGTTRTGNSMRRVADYTRKNYGVVNEEDWDWDRDSMTWAEYYSNIPEDVMAKGRAWLKEWDFKYQSVYPHKNLMKEALKVSPLWVAGFAWAKNGGLYRSYGRANHAFTIIGYKESEYWLVFDSYDEHIKKLDWNYNFPYVRTITLEKKKLEFNEAGIKDFFEKRKPQEYIQVIPSGAVYRYYNSELKKLTIGEITDDGIKELKKSGKIDGISTSDFSNIFYK